MKKLEVKMNKPAYLGQAILDISKALMYEFWNNYIKLKYEDKARLCYMDTYSFVINIKLKIFIKIFLIMLKNGSIHLTMIKRIKDHFQ